MSNKKNIEAVLQNPTSTCNKLISIVKSNYIKKKEEKFAFASSDIIKKVLVSNLEIDATESYGTYVMQKALCSLINFIGPH